MCCNQRVARAASARKLKAETGKLIAEADIALRTRQAEADIEVKKRQADLDADEARVKRAKLEADHKHAMDMHRLEHDKYQRLASEEVDLTSAKARLVDNGARLLGAAVGWLESWASKGAQ